MYRDSKLNVIALGMLCFILPILILIDNQLRPSISDYAYSQHNHIFTMLLTFAGSIFVFNGTDDDDNVIGRYKANSKWYNIITGLSLIVVAITPHLDYTVLHYIFAILFFLSGSVNMVLFSSDKQRWFKLIGAFFVILSLVSSFIFNWNLAIMEQLAILPIAFNLLGENIGKLD